MRCFKSLPKLSKLRWLFGSGNKGKMPPNSQDLDTKD